MATIAVTPLVLKDYLLKIDADNYEKAVSAVILTPPSPQSVTWQGPIGSEFSDETSSGAWTCQVDHAQDWETTDSLSAYLFDNDGQTKTLEFVPRSGAGLPKFTVDVVIRPGQVGGTTRQYATSSARMTCVTKPVRGTVGA